MRVLVFVKATEESEAGAIPPPELFEAMGNFNEELVKAGVLLDAGGLLPSSRGARVKFSGKDRTVIDGPFAETKELVAGFWVWQVKSLEEAIEWVKRIPNPTGDDGVIEIRPLAEAEDFGEALPDDVREQEERLSAEVARQKLA